jgi:uncharacterized protein
MTTQQNNDGSLTAVEVLRRYKDEALPAFAEIPLDDVNQIGNFGERPLNVASVRGRLEEVTALVEAGADVNARGELGNTALHEAVGQGNVEVVKFLIERGASPTVSNNFGETPLDTARLQGRPEILALL